MKEDNKTKYIMYNSRVYMLISYFENLWLTTDKEEYIMPRQAPRSEPKEILETLNKLWLNTTDIKIIASVGLDKARAIKDEIANNLTGKGWYLPTGMVPSSKVIEYLKIDMKYLEKMANKNLGKDLKYENNKKKI